MDRPGQIVEPRWNCDKINEPSDLTVNSFCNYMTLKSKKNQSQFIQSQCNISLE